MDYEVVYLTVLTSTHSNISLGTTGTKATMRNSTVCKISFVTCGQTRKDGSRNEL